MNRIFNRKLGFSVSCAALAAGLVLSSGGTALATAGTGGNGTDGFGLNLNNKFFGGSQINTAGKGVAGRSG